MARAAFGSMRTRCRWRIVSSERYETDPTGRPQTALRPGVITSDPPWRGQSCVCSRTGRVVEGGVSARRVARHDDVGHVLLEVDV